MRQAGVLSVLVAVMLLAAGRGFFGERQGALRH